MTDYQFYSTTYLAGRAAVFDAAVFPFWERMASEKVRSYTFGNIDETETIPESVQLCVCEVAECLLRQKKQKERGLSSEKVDDYSVSYLNDTRAESEADVSEIINRHLANTGLMYCGG